MNDTVRLLLFWVCGLSAVTFLLFGWDKQMAKLGRRRIPEATLWAAALLGGGVGGFLGMTVFRHKTRKGFFPVGLPILALAQPAILLWVVAQR